MSKKLVHEESRANGLTLRFETTQSSMRATALRGGKVLATASQGHGGLYGPSSWKPEETPMAKALLGEVEDKALSRVRRGAFDQLVNDLRVARDTKRVTGRTSPALFVGGPLRKPSKPAKTRAALFFSSRKR